jgi:hypothetical protein
MAEPLELHDASRFDRRLRARDASHDTEANGPVGVPNPAPVTELVHRTTSNSNETHHRDPSVVESVPAVDLPARPLELWDVASLIINKMIGTGIFTAPPTVLLMTGSPSLAFGLWILGFAYTIVRCAITHSDGDSIH